MSQPAGAGPSAQQAIGGSNRRIDTLGKVTGTTRYVEDIVMPGMLYARVLRSPYHHARLLALDTSLAASMPGVVRVLTAEDIPGLNGLDGYSCNEPVLTPVGDTARQRGAPVALVIAESPRQAAAALAALQASYEILQHTFTASDALQPDVVPIYPDGNVLNTFEVRFGDLDAAFGGSDLVLETQYRTAFQEHSTLERDATLGYIGEDDLVTVIGGTHEPHWQQGYIAQTLGLPPEQVRVIFPPTGGSFGDRQDPWPLVAAGLAAHITGRPVRLAYSRREAFDATPKRHPYDLRFKIGATAQGRLTGAQVRIDANTGGYDSAGFWIPNYAVTGSGGPYLWQAVDAYARSVYTNGPKCGQFRGYGAPQGVFGIECALDEICERLAIDPLAFRLVNCLPQDAVSFLGYPVKESLGYREVLEAVRPRYEEYRREAAAFNRSHDEGDLRMGVGLAGMWYRFGKSGSLAVEAHAELSSDGYVVAYCSAPDYGQGINTVMVQIAAETLSIPRERIRLVNADTANTPDSGIQGASRATYFTGSALRIAMQNLRDEILGVAAEMLDQAPGSLSLAVDHVVAQGSPERAISLSDIAREFDALGKPRRVIGIFDLTPFFPEESRPEYVPLFTTGAQAAQVVVDNQTGQVEVTRLVAAHDVGRAINPPNAVGQIQGAILMGIGTALSEQYIPGVTTGFTDYILPMIGAVPEMEVHLVEVPSYHGPLGAKGLGEAAIMPTAPAILNAVSRTIGVRLHEVPATPPRVLAALRSSGRRE